jgi:hypothetical protein
MKDTTFLSLHDDYCWKLLVHSQSLNNCQMVLVSLEAWDSLSVFSGLGRWQYFSCDLYGNVIPGVQCGFDVISRPRYWIGFVCGHAVITRSRVHEALHLYRSDVLTEVSARFDAGRFCRLCCCVCINCAHQLLFWGCRQVPYFRAVFLNRLQSASQVSE